MGACGDDTRNITGCPVAGVDADEIVDASPLVQAATRMLNGNSAFYNLPRKFKISITGCRVWCSYPEINDIGLTAVEHPVTGEVGFSARVGGGLSTNPHLAPKLNAFVHWNQVLPVVRGIAEIFRDSDGSAGSGEGAAQVPVPQPRLDARTVRERARAASGWGLDPAVAETPPADVYRDHVGFHAQKQPGYSTPASPCCGAACRPDQMRTAADLADRYGSGELRRPSCRIC